MPDINIKLSMDEAAQGVSGGSSSTADALRDVLQKLTAAINKLTAQTTGAIQKESTVANIRSSDPINPSNSSSPLWRGVGDKIGSVIGASLGVAIGAGFSRHFFNEATAIMSRATATGQFAASGVQGTANQNYGNYINSLYSTEKAREIANRNATYESVAGGTAGIVGGVASAAGDLLSGIPLIGGIGKALSHSARIAATAAGVVGAGKGAELAANKNQYTEESFTLRGAMAKREADASAEQWKTAFSRWKPTNYLQEVASSQLTGSRALSVPLSRQFEERYRQSPNYNAILNNIAPYLNTNPLSQKNGNLSDVAERFQKAGFAVSDFSKLTIQSAQYSALTGKNLDSFSKDIVQARARFGDAYDTGTQQTALNLMAVGYGQRNAESIAYQAQFNPNLASNVNRFNNIGVSEFYRNKALSQATGIDINASLRGGQFVGSSKAREELERELKNEQDGKSYGQLLTVLNQGGGFSPAQLRSLLQPRVAESKAVGDTSTQLSPAQQAAKDIQGAIQNGFSNVQSMNVNAQTVVINQAASGNKQATQEFIPFSLPKLSARSMSPANR